MRSRYRLYRSVCHYPRHAAIMLACRRPLATIGLGIVTAVWLWLVLVLALSL